MFHQLKDRIAAQPKEALLLAGGLAVILAQLFAMADVVAGQVERAAHRENVRETTRVAMMECLDSNPRMTVRACSARAAMDVADAGGRYDDGYAARAAVVSGIQGGVVPVNFYAVR